MSAPFLIDPALISVPAAFTLGFVFGLGPCLVACLPTLGPVFLCAGQGIKKSWQILLPLMLGRLTVYAGSGALAGSLGEVLEDAVPGAQLHLLVGVATLLLGLGLLVRKWSGKTSCGGLSKPLETQPLRRMPRDKGLLPGGLYLMGISLALTPCGPLTAVLGAAAMTGLATSGLLLGLVFGLGAQIGSILIYGLGVAYFGQQLRAKLGVWQPRIEWLSGGLLLLVGGVYILRAIIH